MWMSKMKEINSFYRRSKIYGVKELRHIYTYTNNKADKPTGPIANSTRLSCNC